MNKFVLLTAGVIGSATLAATPASAQQRLSEECRSEVQSLCDTQDRQARRACMQEKFAELSEGCQSAITEMRAAREERRANGEASGERRQRGQGGNRQGGGQMGGAGSGS